jgi:hypothetical protein
MECDREVRKIESMTMVHHLSRRRRVSEYVVLYYTRTSFLPITTVLTSAGGWRAITIKMGSLGSEKKAKGIHDGKKTGERMDL